MNKYSDIINRPRHVSKKHPHMSLYDRAAQFSPFAALTGHDAAVKETARLTDRRIELDESEKAVLNEKLQQLYASVEKVSANKSRSMGADAVNVWSEHEQYPSAEITYFKPDALKDGGEYVVKRGGVKKFDMYRRIIIMEDMEEIKIDDVAALEVLSLQSSRSNQKYLKSL